MDQKRYNVYHFRHKNKKITNRKVQKNLATIVYININKLLFDLLYLKIHPKHCYALPLPPPLGQQAGLSYALAVYSSIRRYLYTVGLDNSQILASSLTFIFPAIYVG